MKQRLSLSFITTLFLFIPHSQSIIIESGITHLEQKPIYLYADRHTKKPHPQDTNQLAALSALFAKREQNDPTKLHLLIERPPLIMDQKRILSRLTNTIDKAPLIHTSWEDIEIRCYSHAAAFLLQPMAKACAGAHIIDTYDSHTTLPTSYKVASRSCNPNTISFADVFDEFETHSNTLKKRFYTDPGKMMRKLYDQKTAVAFNYLKQLHKTMNTYDVHKAAQIAQVVHSYKDKKTQNTMRLALQRPLIEAFIPLFDLHALARILAIHKTDAHVSIFAGYRHIWSIHEMLNQLTSHTSRYYSPYMTSPDCAPPLDIKHLDLFTGTPFCTIL